MNDILVKKLIEIALEEDISTGDITTESCIDENHQSSAVLIGKQDLIFCGKEIFEEIFKILDPEIKIDFHYKDGDKIKPGVRIAELTGLTHAILKAERTALNFVQRLSGIATNTYETLSLVKNSNFKVVDTRKTTPGWRALEKYAVKTGGGYNHRFGLYDAVLIKNNHIDANQGDLALCVKKAKQLHSDVFIQVEVRDQKELDTAIGTNPSSILLDNMSVKEVKDSVIKIKKSNTSILVEVSGGISKANIENYVNSGVDRVSVGALTHSAIAVDLSLRVSCLN